MGSAGAENLRQGTRWCAWAATQEAVRVLQGELGIIGRRRPWECQAAGPGRPGTADMLSLQPSCREQGCEGHGAQSCLPTSCHLSLLSPQKGPWAGTWPGSFTGACVSGPGHGALKISCPYRCRRGAPGKEGPTLCC